MIKSFTVAVICSLLSICSATAQVLSIDSCYALAVKNYPLIKQYELIEKTKEYTLSNASKAYLPQVSFTAIEGYILGGLPSFGEPGGSGSSDSKFKFIGLGQVNQTIWDGGATKTQKQIINASSEADKASADVALYDLRSRVNQLYFGVLLVDEQLKQLEVQYNILKNNINRIKLMKDNGLAYKTDVDEIKAEQLKLDQQKIEFNYTRTGYVNMLSLLIGEKIEKLTTLQAPLTSNRFTDTAITRPELSLYKSQRSLVTAQGGMQHVNLMPKIGVLGAAVLLAPGISFGAGKLSSIGVVGLSASWNTGGLYTNSNEKKLTQQSLNKINVQEQTFLFNTRLQLSQSNANINKQKAILAEDDEIVSLRQTIREGYQLKYDNGAGPLYDLLNATQKESDARAQKATHEMQLLMTLYDYKTISGN
ncbi:MAG TPA: TolC family protein [Mucilaginibacter sp.]|jgi:outer membrane protein TolC